MENENIVSYQAHARRSILEIINVAGTRAALLTLLRILDEIEATADLDDVSEAANA